MIDEELRAGLIRIAQDVQTGIHPSRIHKHGLRQRRRHQALGTLSIIGLLSAAAVLIHVHHGTAAATLGERPNAVTLPPYVREGMRSDVGDQETGTGLTQYGAGTQALVLVGLRGQGKTCTVYFHPNDKRAGWGASCNNSDTALPPGQTVSLGGGGLSDSEGHASFVLYGSGPAGTASFTLRAPNGRQLTITDRQAASDWDNRAYFVVPWVDGATKARALDGQGSPLGCAVLGSDENCLTTPGG